MATKFEFYLNDDDTERLFAIKEDMGKDELTGNEYARELLERTLYQMHPSRVRYDEAGERIKDVAYHNNRHHSK
jgi:hypothetical protein